MSEYLDLAKRKLVPSNIEAGFPGREDHAQRLYLFLTQRLKTHTVPSECSNIRFTHCLQMNKTIYLCGVPGTGKTAILNHVMERLNRESAELTQFDYVYLNAQFIPSPDRLYQEIVRKLTKEKLPKDTCVRRLEKMFMAENGRHIKKGEKFYIVAIDEVDLLCGERRNKNLYALFDWPTDSGSKLILIIIANAMDLGEGLSGRLQSRLGWEKVIFDSYKSDQLQYIIESKLGPDLAAKTFTPTSLIYASKRVGRTTGDARRMIDTCCLALDQAIAKGEKMVTIKIISSIGFHNIDKDRQDFIETLSPMSLMTLKCILKVGEDVGEENVTSMQVYERMLDFVILPKFKQFFKGFILEPRRFCVILDDFVASSIVYLEEGKPWPLKRVSIKDSSPLYRDIIRAESITSKMIPYEE